jgi:AraC-like DNA-binding protein
MSHYSGDIYRHRNVLITETHLRASRRMLAHTDTPIAMVAADCGFSHQSHMGSAFRHALGMTHRASADEHTDLSSWGGTSRPSSSLRRNQ